MLFDGRAFAREIEERVQTQVLGMARKPRLASVLVGHDPASELYTKLKMAAARRCGIEFEMVRMERWDEGKVREIGEKRGVTGLMVQMPLLRRGSGGQAIPYSREEQLEAVRAIPLDKDVDGLRWEKSGVVPATVRAILTILDKIGVEERDNYVVVGDRGSVGRPLVHYLQQRGIKPVGVNTGTREMERVVREAEVIISCAGRPGLVTGDMVREGVVAIDVGSPRGDMTSKVYAKASLATPVPGGVGPVTVACLMQNAVDMVESRG